MMKYNLVTEILHLFWADALSYSICHLIHLVELMMPCIQGLREFRAKIANPIVSAKTISVR